MLAAMGESITRDELVREVARPARRRPGAGRAARLRRRSAGRRRRRASPEAAAAAEGEPPPRAPTQALSARERRERALLAMCVASPAEGREFLERARPRALLVARSRPAPGSGCGRTSTTRWPVCRATTRSWLAYHRASMMTRRARAGQRARRWSSTCSSSSSAMLEDGIAAAASKAAATHRSSSSAAARSSRSGSRGRSRSLGERLG